jgi:serine/threonine protein kinase/Flp pilus assembly protein TadD
MNDSLHRDVAVFTEAFRLKAGERATYLERVCGDDHDLRRRVEALLQAHDQAGDFLAPPLQGASVPTHPVAFIGEQSGDRVGRFKLLQQIGEGGCGVVFMAEQVEPVCRRVALKIIKPGMDSKSVIARFVAERQALALMDHPNIAKIFDAGATESGRPYFVMELVRGVKITEYCDHFSLTTEERLRLFVQVCQAIQHAHQKGIIHRDIKPSNILVTTTQEGKALPVVIDFGIAKATTNQRLTDKTLFTAFEMLIGTPAYMSPEQAAISSVDVDTRTDIYSLGVLLYELLTSSTPFNAKELLEAGLDEIRRVIREQEPVRPSTCLSKLTNADLKTLAQHRKSEPPTLIRAVRGDLDWIAIKALEKDRTRRYATANGLAVDVERFLAGEPISARPPSKLYKLQKTLLRNKLVFVGLGVIALLMVTSLIIVSASLGKERRSRRSAEAASVKSQQTTKLLEQLLQGVKPSIALGRDTTMVREMLDLAVGNIGKEMTNQPAVEAELWSLIGRVYEQIGSYGRAEEMHRAALEINRRIFGSESPEAAASLNNLGLALMAKRQLPEAERVDREALAIRRRFFGDNNADTATSLNDLGAVYREEGRLTEAEALARQALGIREKLFGAENLDVADSSRNLCVILGDEGKWIESEAIARTVLKMRRKLLGPEHPWVASALDDVAWAAKANGKKDEAEDLQREALAMRQKLLPPDHPNVADSLRLVGDTMRERGNLNEAFSVLSAALSIQRKVLGEDDPAALETMHSLGLTLEGQHKWSEAESVWRNILTIRRKPPRADDPQTVYALRDLGRALEGEDKWSDAESAHREELALCRRLFGAEDPQTLYALEKLAATLGVERKWPEAENARREALITWRKRAGNEDPKTLYALRDLTETLDSQRKWGEAEAFHREALAGWRKRAGDEDPQTLYERGKLDSILEAEGKWADLEILRREELAYRRKRMGDENPLTLYALRALGLALEEEDKWPEAETVWRDSLPIWRKQAGNEDQQSMYTLRKLGLALEAERKWPEAEAVHREALAVSRKLGGNQGPEAIADLERLVRVLLAQQKFGEAEQFLEEELTPEFGRQASSLNLSIQRINLLGRQGRWQEAAASATAALELQPNEQYRYHTLAGLLAMTHDRPAYEQLCQRQLTNFASPTKAFVAERMAQDYLILPNSGVDLELVDKLADTAVTVGIGNESMPYYQACKAMSEYRLGHFPQAVSWAERATNSSIAGAQAKAYAVLAMADWQLGQKDAARVMLAKGDALAPRMMAKGETMDLGELWVAWLFARVSLDEATALIESDSSMTELSKKP